MTKELRFQGEPLDLIALQGQTISFRFTWREVVDGVAGEPITDYEARMQVRRTPGEEPVLSLTEDDGIDVLEDGERAVTIASEAMAEVEPGRYSYQIESTTGDPILHGRFLVQSEAAK